MKELVVIQKKDPCEQLELFLLALSEKKVPVIVTQKFDSSWLKGIFIPEEADFAVSSSGTTGKPKIYFRTLESWKDFFGEQNRIFGIKPDARIFINGSLAFTGNLNIAVSAFFSKQYLYVSKELRPQVWAKEIKENQIDTIYMIPDKLLYLVKSDVIFPEIKTILLGSQPVSKEFFHKIKKAFPSAQIILYYGATETNYISYKFLTEGNTEQTDCIGKIFDSVQVKISSENHICVKSDFCVLGINDFYDTKDIGFIKDGILYLSGRADDVINIHGQKINKSEIEKCLLKIPEVEEAAVTVEEINCVKSVVAHVSGKNIPCRIDPVFFKEIQSVFIPKKYVFYEKLPRNESGKVSGLSASFGVSQVYSSSNAPV